VRERSYANIIDFSVVWSNRGQYDFDRRADKISGDVDTSIAQE
jgi:hypothetical protein